MRYDFDITKDNYKYFCHSCGSFWFAPNMFQDCCPVCEEYEHFTFTELKDTDKDTYSAKVDMVELYKERIKTLEDQIEDLSWVKDNGWQTVI